MGALDDRGLEAELRGADRGDIAARAGADDDDVETRVSHVPQVHARDRLILAPTPDDGRASAIGNDHIGLSSAVFTQSALSSAKIAIGRLEQLFEARRAAFALLR